jgi:Fic family protein
MTSPSKNKRMSLSAINEDFEKFTMEEKSDANASTKFTAEKNFLSTLRGTFGKNWPAWNSVRGIQKGNPLNFTISISPGFRTVVKDEEKFEYGGMYLSCVRLQHGLSCLAIVRDVVSLFNNVRNAQGMMTVHDNDAFYQVLEESMIEAVFGSNQIEEAGLNERLTVKICRAIFRGIHVDAESYDARDPDYQESLKTQNPSHQEIVRSRAEVIQHAKALELITNAVVYNNELLSEELIKTTHRILCLGQDLDTPAGDYRTHEIGAYYGGIGQKKSTKFINPSAVPKYMDRLCREYNEDIADAEASGIIDPMTLAARYCSLFVNIHPFADGNGRMCRLILNSIMLKYAGICIAIGDGNDEERKEYLQMTTRASKLFYQEDMEVEKADQKAHLELGVIVIKKARATLHRLHGAMSRGGLANPKREV